MERIGKVLMRYGEILGGSGRIWRGFGWIWGGLGGVWADSGGLGWAVGSVVAVLCSLEIAFGCFGHFETR